MPPPPEKPVGGASFSNGFGTSFPSGVAHMQAGLTRALLFGDDKAGIVHAERAGDVLTEIAIDALPAGDLNQLADIVDAAAIGPSCARLEHQRPARQRRIGPRGFQVTNDVRIPQRVAEAGGVRQQVSQRDRLVRRPQLRNAFGIEARKDLRRGERRIDIGRPARPASVCRARPVATRPPRSAV